MPPISPARRLRLLAVAVFSAGIAMAAAGGTMAAWAWVTPGTHLLFRIALPLCTAWLLVAMMRLAIALPDALQARADVGRADDAPPTDPLAALAAAPRRPPDRALHGSSADAEFVQQVALPAEPGPTGRRRRRPRVAQRIGLRDGRHLYRVGPLPRPARPRRLAVGAAVAVAVAAIGLLVLLEPFGGEGADWLIGLASDP